VVARRGAPRQGAPARRGTLLLRGRFPTCWTRGACAPRSDTRITP